MLTVTRDVTSPKISMSCKTCTTLMLTNKNSVGVEIDFDGDGVVLTEQHIQVSAPSQPPSDLYYHLKTISPSRYSLHVSGISQDGLISISTTRGIQDYAGNPALPSSIYITRDTVPPRAPLFNSSVGTITRKNTIKVAIDMREEVQLLGKANFVVTTTGSLVAIWDVYVSDRLQGLYLFNAELSGEGALKVAFNQENPPLDLAGNRAHPAEITITRDISPPGRPQFSTTDGNFVSQSDKFLFQLDFGEPVLDFSDSDIQVISATTQRGEGKPVEIPSLSDPRSGQYTIEVSALHSDGKFAVSFVGGGATDLAGNPVPENTFSFTKDTLSPSIPRLSSSVGNVTRNSLFEVVVTVNKPVADLTEANVQIITELFYDLQIYKLNDYEYSLDLSDVTGEGPLTVRLIDVEDRAGYTVPPASITIQRDTTPPVAPLLECPEYTSKTRITCSVIFHENVLGFSSKDVSVLPRADLVEVRNNDLHGGNYTVTISVTLDGAYTVAVPAGAVTDLAGNPNPAEETTFIRDTTTYAGPQFSYYGPVSSEETPYFVVTADFQEAVLGVSLASFAVSSTNGVLMELRDFVVDSSWGEGIVRMSLYTYSPADVMGVVTVEFAGGEGTTDLAGNRLQEGASIDIDVDNRAPKLLSMGLKGGENVTRDSAVEFMVEFDETVTLVSGIESFFVSDATAMIESVRELPSPYGQSSSFVVSVIGLSTEGEFAFGFKNQSIQDAGKNFVQGAKVSVGRDTTPPVLTMVSPAGSHTFLSSLSISFEFSETVVGFNRNDLVITSFVEGGGWYVGDLTSSSVDGDRYSLSITDISTDGFYTLALPAGSVTDIAGNSAPRAEITFIKDTKRPVPVISSASGSLHTNQVQFGFIIDFDEVVQDFKAESMRISPSGSIRTLEPITQGRYNVYVDELDADGAYTLEIPENSVTDLAGNPCKSGRVTIYRDTTPPLAPSVLELSRTGGQEQRLLLFDFHEEVIGFERESLSIAVIPRSSQVSVNSIRPINAQAGAYTVAIAGLENRFEECRITLIESVVTDLAGNPVPSSTFSIEPPQYDFKGDLKLSSAVGSVTRESRWSIIIDFGTQVAEHFGNCVNCIKPSCSSIAINSPNPPPPLTHTPLLLEVLLLQTS